MKAGRSEILLLASALALVFAGMAAGQAAKIYPPNDQTAVGCLRTINTAELVYSKTYRRGYSKTLAALGMAAGQSKPTADAAKLIDEQLTTGMMGGYRFVYKAGAKDAKGSISKYTVVARPLKWRKSVPSFFTDQSGVIRVTKENREPAHSDHPIE